MMKRITLAAIALVGASALPAHAQLVSARPSASSVNRSDYLLCNQGANSPVTKKCQVSGVFGVLQKGDLTGPLGGPPVLTVNGVAPGSNGDVSVTTSSTIPDGSVTASKLASGAAQGNLGFPPVKTVNGTAPDFNGDVAVSATPADGSITAQKLASGAAASNQGFGAADPGTLKQDLINPTLLDCPVANCPVENPTGSDPNHATQRQVRSAHILQGETPIDDPLYPFWEASIGLLNDKGAPNGQEVTLYTGMVQTPTAGTGWTLNTDILRCGTVPTDQQIAAGNYATHGHVGSGRFCDGSQHLNIGAGTIGYELDFGNYDRDCLPFVANQPFCVGIFYNFTTRYMGWAWNFYGGGSYNASTYPYFGMFDGNLFVPGSVKNAAVHDASNDLYSLQASGVHTSATLADGSFGGHVNDVTGTGVSAFHNAGAMTDSTILDNSNSPRTIHTSGSRSVATIDATDTAPTLINASGNHSTIVSTASDAGGTALNMRDGQKVCFNNSAFCVYHSSSGDKLVFLNAADPIMSIDAGGTLRVRNTVLTGVTP